MDVLSIFRRGQPPATTLIQAQEILGEKNVFGAERVERVWNESRLQKPSIPYDLSTLKDKAKENKKSDRMWTLVYVIGLSLLQQRDKRGVDPKNVPCFMETGVWRDPEYVFSLLGESGSSGYRLLDFSLPYRNMVFAAQSDEIAKNRRCQRVSARTVSEASLSILMLSELCPLKFLHHNSAITKKSDCVLRLVYEPNLGLALHTSLDMPRPDTGAVICQLYDIAPIK